jgi:4-amino-4-deoxy-L-arabinose transferase-like glycosyltransferase
MSAPTFSFFVRRPQSGRWFFIVVATYLAVLFTLRVLLFPGASEDDAEQLFYAQTFALGYMNNQPPLYTWLVIAFERVFGIGAPTVEIIKFACLFAIYAFFYGAARRVLKDPTMAVIAGLSPVGIYYIGWDSVMNYSHSVLMMAILAATVYQMLRLEERARWFDYGALGITLGLGMLAKYNYPLFAGPFLIAAAFHPGLRRRVLAWPMAASLIVAGIIAAPHLVELALRPPPGLDRSLPPIGKLAGLQSAFTAALSFASPLFVLFVLFFLRAFRPLPPAAQISASSRRVFEVYFLLLAVIVIGAILVLREAEVRTHWLAVMLPFPLYILMRAEAAGVGGRPAAGLLGLLSVLALIVPAVMIANALVSPARCKKCNFFVPYADLARQIRAAGFSMGTVLAHDYPNQLSGNLRPYFPQARFVSMRFKPFDPPPGAPGACLIVWNAALDPTPGTGVEMVNYARQRFGANIPSETPLRHVEAPIQRAGGRTVRLLFLLYSGERQGRCR